MFTTRSAEDAVRAEWGRNIAQFRVWRGYPTQAALAEKLGVSNRAVSMWELGKRAPRDAMRAHIAEVLGVDVAAVFPPMRRVA